MSMTGAECISAARILIDEPSTAALTSAQMVVLLNAANLEVYRRLCAVNPDYFLVRATITFPGATEYIDLSGSSYLNASVFKILGIECTAAAGGVTASNGPTKLQPMAFQDRNRYLGTGGYASYAPSQWPAHYSLVGANTLYLSPISGSALNLTVYYVPQLTALTTGTLTSEVLGGLADEFHDAVTYCLAHLCNAKGRGSAPLSETLWQEACLRIDNSAGSRELDEPRRVRYKGLHG